MLYWVVKGVLTPVLRVCFRVQGRGPRARAAARPGDPRRRTTARSSTRSSSRSCMRRRVTFVAKAEYFDDPKTAWFFRGVRPDPDPARGRQRERARARVGDRGACARAACSRIYPEGTRTRDGYLHRGHTGVARLALRTGTPIVPVGLIGTDEVQPVDKRMPRLFRAGDDPLRRAARPGALRRPRAGAPRAARAHRRGDVRDRPALGLRVRRHVRDEEGRGHPDRGRARRVVRRRSARPRPRRRSRVAQSCAQSRERSTARCQVGHARASRSASSIAGANDASALPGRVHRGRASPTRPRRGRRGTRRRARSSPAPRRAARARRAGRPGTGRAGPSPTRRRRRASRRARCRSPRAIASTTSAVWNAIDSTTARARCARLVPRVMPTIVPRAYGSHHGEPSPVNAGTT